MTQAYEIEQPISRAITARGRVQSTVRPLVEAGVLRLELVPNIQTQASQFGRWTRRG